MEEDSLVSSRNNNGTPESIEIGSAKGRPTSTKTIPVENFTLLEEQKCRTETQSSFVTIFVLWNTMMGTTLLSIPWAMESAGVIPAIILLTSVAGLSFYTAYRILQVYETHGGTAEVEDFGALCSLLIGRWAKVIAVVFSALVLLGASIVYWILMSNSLYYTVNYIHKAISDSSVVFNQSGNALCPSENASFHRIHLVEENESFHRIWDLHSTVPLFLVLLVGPITCSRSPTFFTKFNCWGTLSVLFLLVFIGVKWTQFGFHVNLYDQSNTDYTSLYKSNWAAFSGVLSMAFFIHNGILTLMKNNRHKQNNKRDLGVAFVLVAMTYFLVGAFFLSVFPLMKTCIEDNLLNNFGDYDIWAFIGRLFLFFQMVTMFPLIVYILRIQVWESMKKMRPTVLQTVFSNIIIISICVSFAIKMPKIGKILRFTGSSCGLVYIFILPITLHLLSQRKISGTLTLANVGLHICLLILGVSNFCLQFFVSE